MIMPISVARAVSVGEFAGLLWRPSSSEPGTIAFARPKSRTFTRPSLVTLMFAGFKSRWTTPSACAASRASAI
jgi:hypothetical protein